MSGCLFFGWAVNSSLDNMESYYQRHKKYIDKFLARRDETCSTYVLCCQYPKRQHYTFIHSIVGCKYTSCGLGQPGADDDTETLFKAVYRWFGQRLTNQDLDLIIYKVPFSRSALRSIDFREAYLFEQSPNIVWRRSEQAWYKQGDFGEVEPDLFKISRAALQVRTILTELKANLKKPSLTELVLRHELNIDEVVRHTTTCCLSRRYINEPYVIYKLLKVKFEADKPPIFDKLKI